MVMLNPHSSISLFPTKTGSGQEGNHFLGCWAGGLRPGRLLNQLLSLFLDADQCPLMV